MYNISETNNRVFSQCVRGDLFPDVKRPGREADFSALMPSLKTPRVPSWRSQEQIRFSLILRYSDFKKIFFSF
jgi:hypothetical protein